MATADRPAESRETVPGGADARELDALLLRRPAPPGYLEAWAERVRERPADAARDLVSFGCFRLGGETFALETRHVVEVRPLVRIRPVPGRTNAVFLGLVSLRGVIHLAASLHALFGIEALPTPPSTACLLVVERPGERWALLVDEVAGFDRVDASATRGAQVTVAKAAVHFTDGVVATPRGPAARVDAGRLFDGLARSLS